MSIIIPRPLLKSAIDDLIRGTEPEDIELVRFQDEEEALSLEDLGRLSRQGPVINFVNKLLEQAVALKASDILVEPQEYKLRVRLRVDGMLREQPENNKNMGPLVASRIKVVSDWILPNTACRRTAGSR